MDRFNVVDSLVAVEGKEKLRNSFSEVLREEIAKMLGDDVVVVIDPFDFSLSKRARCYKAYMDKFYPKKEKEKSILVLTARANYEEVILSNVKINKTVIINGSEISRFHLIRRSTDTETLLKIINHKIHPRCRIFITEEGDDLTEEVRISKSIKTDEEFFIKEIFLKGEEDLASIVREEIFPIIFS